MIIEGFTFKAVDKHYDAKEPALFVYKHLASGKCYVRGLSCAGKNILHTDIPTAVKEYLVINPSEMILYACMQRGVGKLELARMVSKLNKAMFAKGVLIDRKVMRAEREELHSSGLKLAHFIWVATDKATDAKYVFVTPAAHTGSDVAATFKAKLATHNAHFRKNVRHLNRTMHEYTRMNGGLTADGWSLQRIAGLHETEQAARRMLTTMSRDLLLNGQVVLNRINNNDALFYRNEILRQPNMCTSTYLGKLALAA